jgi:putative ABC transport system substrate-binding protein
VVQVHAGFCFPLPLRDGIVGKILRGARPADFPIQRPIYPQFLINLSTARFLKLNIPPALSALADEVIE